MEIVETKANKDGSMMLTLEMTDSEANALFRKGLQDVIKDINPNAKVLPPLQFVAEDNISVELSKEEFDAITEYGIINILKENIEKSQE